MFRTRPTRLLAAAGAAAALTLALAGPASATTVTGQCSPPGNSAIRLSISSWFVGPDETYHLNESTATNWSAVSVLIDGMNTGSTHDFYINVSGHGVHTLKATWRHVSGTVITYPTCSKAV